MTKKPKKKEPPVKEQKATIMVRDISKPLWKNIKEAADARRMKLKHAVEEMMEDWLKKEPKKNT